VAWVFVDGSSEDMPEPPAAADRQAAESLFVAWCQREAEGRAEPFAELLAGHPAEHEDLLRLRQDYDEIRSIVDAADPGGMLQRALGGSSERPVAEADTGRTEELVRGLAGDSTTRARYVPGRALAQGGSATILKARDRTLRRDVALKLLSTHGADLPQTARARFLAEAYVTGRLDHPGIVPVHDLGLDARGRLFFTMKLVNGITFREALERIARGEDGWTVNRGVGVLSRVCEAVAYAHSKGVLHRDIKPANVMVGAYGETYLMDWGLARVMAREGERPEAPVDELAPLTAEDLQQLVAAPADQPALPDTWLLTQDGKILGTPVYMSPEQARGEVDKVDERSDIWSLGAMLHHLITGRLPWVEEGERPIPLQVLLRVRQGGLLPARSLAPDAPPTLLAICERALAERPDERYRDAEQMAAALRDYLEDISEAREEARRQEARARGAFDFLFGVLTSGDPAEARGRDVTVREVLDRAAERLGREPPTSPLDEANLRGVLGRLFKEMGRFEEAGQHLELAVARFEELLGANHPDTLHAAADLALVWRRIGRADEAESLLRNTLEAQRATLGDRHSDTLRSLHLLAAQLHRVRGEKAEAERLYREALEGRRLALGERHVDTLVTQNGLAMVIADLGRVEEAVPLLEDACARLVAQLGDDHPAVLIARGDLAHLYLRLDRPEPLAAAEGLYRQALVAQERVVGPTHPDALTVRNNLGMVLLRRGQPREALVELRAAADGHAAALGEAHARTLTFRANTALALLELDRPAEAEPVLRRVVELATGNATVTPLSLGRFRHNLGRCLRALGRREEARSEFEGACAQYLAARLDADHAWIREVDAELEGLRHPSR
jgi:eukaryotic-like serine/threonine-protein kinase